MGGREAGLPSVSGDGGGGDEQSQDSSLWTCTYCTKAGCNFQDNWDRSIDLIELVDRVQERDPQPSGLWVA